MLVDIERGNWGFKIARIGETISTQRAKFGQDVVRAIYLLDILGFLSSMLSKMHLRKDLHPREGPSGRRTYRVLIIIENWREIQHTLNFIPRWMTHNSPDRTIILNARIIISTIVKTPQPTYVRIAQEVPLTFRTPSEYLTALAAAGSTYPHHYYKKPSFPSRCWRDTYG
jgi:hypothetical protein